MEMSSILTSITKAFSEAPIDKVKMEASPDDDAYNEDTVGYSDEIEDQEQPPSQEQETSTEIPANPEYSKTAVTPMKSTKPVPKISDLVNSALLQLKERKGSTVETILAFLVKKYKMDPERSRKNVRGYLKRALSRGAILQTGGEGITATFKLTPATKAEILKGNRAAPVKGKGRAQSTSKRQKEICAMAAAIKRKTDLNGIKTPITISKKISNMHKDCQAKRMRTQVKENGIFQDENGDFDIPAKTPKAPNLVMKPKRNIGKRGGSTGNVGKKSSKTSKSVF